MRVCSSPRIHDAAAQLTSPCACFRTRPPVRYRTPRISALRVEERRRTPRSEAEETRGAPSSFWTLQRYLDGLYPLPKLYELEVVEKARPSTTTPPPPPEDFYVNFGKAIETIKHDFPLLFQRDFDYSIFREDLVFRDPINSFQGLRFYKYMLMSLRWHGRVLFKRVAVRIHHLWPRPEGLLRVRWSIHAIPRIPWEAESIFDGVSEYKLDRHGMIYEHSVDNIIFRDPPVFSLPVLFAELSPVQRHPVPSAWCRMEQRSQQFFLQRFSWVRMYFVLSVVQCLSKTRPAVED